MTSHRVAGSAPQARRPGRAGFPGSCQVSLLQCQPYRFHEELECHHESHRSRSRRPCWSSR